MAARFGMLVVLAAGVSAAVWYATRPKPVTVVVAEADTGRVENTVANTRAGSVMSSAGATRRPEAGAAGRRWPPNSRAMNAVTA